MNLAAYRRVFSIGLQDTFVYRWNFLLRNGFSLFPLAATLLLWKTVLGNSEAVSGYTLPGLVLYFVGVLLVDTLASPTEDEWRIAAEIREGQISALLIKPLDHLAYRLSLFFSYRLVYALVTLPVVALLLWFLRAQIQWPQNPATWPLFLLAAAGSALIQFFIAYSLAMLAFWILEVSTVVFILYSFEYFLSGHVFPLDWMPPAARALLQWTPFPSELFFPIQILLEKLPRSELLHGFELQLFWVLLTGCIARFLWHRGIKRYQGVGI